MISFFVYMKIFDKLLQNHWLDFEIISQRGSLGDPLPKLFKEWPPGSGAIHMAARERSAFSFYVYMKTSYLEDLAWGGIMDKSSQRMVTVIKNHYYIPVLYIL